MILELTTKEVEKKLEKKTQAWHSGRFKGGAPLFLGKNFLEAPPPPLNREGQPEWITEPLTKVR